MFQKLLNRNRYLICYLLHKKLTDVKPAKKKEVLEKHLNICLRNLQVVSHHAYPDQPLRMSKLLLMLPHIRQVALKGISLMFEHLSKSAADLPVDLLKEMLCAPPERENILPPTPPLPPPQPFQPETYLPDTIR